MHHALAAVIAMAVPGYGQELQVDADFPGGNIVLDRIEGDDLYVHQDLRDTAGDWFYWCFRVRGAAGRTVTVHFTGSNVIGTRGPAVSADGGTTWEWLGPVDGQDFTYAAPQGAAEVRFSFAVPYLEADLEAFLEAHADDPHLRVDVLCGSRKGRDVELLRLGKLDAEPQHRVLLTCRHHCCEMMASYELEGLIEAALEDEWLREQVEFLIVPFMDKDGVEDGDQGKNRKPRDHNRDYVGESLYPETAALRELVPGWAGGKLRAALDLHCPYIRGGNNEAIYFVGGPDETVWANVGELCTMLVETREGPLPYHIEDNLPFGQGWNTAASYEHGKSFSRWAAELPGVEVASTIEFPYANARKMDVTPDNARAFGRDLARAIRRYLQTRGADE